MAEDANQGTGAEVAAPSAAAQEPQPQPHRGRTSEELERDLRDAVRESAERKRMLREREEELQRSRDRIIELEKQELERKGEWQTLAQKEREEAQRRVEDAQRKIEEGNRRMVMVTLRARARESGILDPEFVKLMDNSMVRVEGDEVVGVDEAIEQCRKARPHWFKSAEAPAPGGQAVVTSAATTTSAGRVPPSATSPNAGATKHVREMSQSEYEQAKAEALRQSRAIYNGQKA